MQASSFPPRDLSGGTLFQYPNGTTVWISEVNSNGQRNRFYIDEGYYKDNNKGKLLNERYISVEGEASISITIKCNTLFRASTPIKDFPDGNIIDLRGKKWSPNGPVEQSDSKIQSLFPFNS